MGTAVSVGAAVLVHDIHSRRSVPAAQIAYKSVRRIVIADSDHGMQVSVHASLSVLRNKRVVIFLDCSHNKKLDQAGRLLSLGIHRSVCILRQIAYIS